VYIMAIAAVGLATFVRMRETRGLPLG
jgi:hypothetical protein